MLKQRLNQSFKAFCVALITNYTIYPAYAEMPDHIQNAIDEANADEIKPNAAELFWKGSTENSFVFDGEEIDASELLYGTTPPAKHSNDLPEVSKYEHLYPYRDDQINNARSSTGMFTASGGVNAEQNAHTILGHSKELPSIRTEEFLFPSRDLVSDPATIRGEFADCTITYDYGRKDVVYESTVTETCERLAVDQTPVYGQRTYLGPDDTFTVTGTGPFQCHKNGKSYTVSEKSTCSLLNIMDRIPAGVKSVKNCTSRSDGCVRIELRAVDEKAYGASVAYPAGSQKWLFTNYSSWSDFCQDITYKNRPYGSRLNLCSSDKSKLTKAQIDWVLDSPSMKTKRPFYFGNYGPWSYKCSPQNRCYTYSINNEMGHEHPAWKKSNKSMLKASFYHGYKVLSKGRSLHRDKGDEDTPGDTEYREYQILIYPYTYESYYIPSKGKVFMLNRNELHAAMVWHYTGGWNVEKDDDETTFRLNDGINVTSAKATISSDTSIVSFRHNETNVPLSKSAWSNLPILSSNKIRTHEFQLIGDPPTPVTATIEFHFENILFTPWLIDEERLASLEDTKDIPFCTVTYNCSETADTDGDSCVNALSNDTGAPKICGASIPTGIISPTDLTDRACTKLDVSIDCTGGIADGEGAYETADTCTEYEEDPACSFTSRDCLVENEDGTCRVYDYVYQCGVGSVISVPTVTPDYSCGGDITCLGEDCALNNSDDATIDLADVATKLSSLDMILADADCGELSDPSIDPEEAMTSCILFKGKPLKCKQIVLGLANCCKKAKGVNFTNYIHLLFATSRLNASLTSMGIENAFTSTWTTLGDFARNSWTELKRPFTEVWESIVGNTTAASSGPAGFTVAAAKQAMMKNAAKWTAEVFGKEAAASIFQAAGGGSAFAADGALKAGIDVAFTPAVQSFIHMVSTAYMVYAVAAILVEILFACTDDEQELMVKKALRSTHYVGKYCSNKFLGICTQKKQSYCSYNSPLSRILNEQVKIQTGKGYGSAKKPSCEGFTLAEFNAIDVNALDLSEWTGMMVENNMLDVDAAFNIEHLTGSDSTLGKALEDLYPRENALERNLKRVDGVNFDDNRIDAVNDFGTGAVRE